MSHSPVIRRLFRNNPVVVDFAPALSSVQGECPEEDSFSSLATVTRERSRRRPAREEEIPDDGFAYAPKSDFAEFPRF